MSPRSPRLAQGGERMAIGLSSAGTSSEPFLPTLLLYTFRKSILEPARFGVPEMAWDNFYV